VAEAALQKLLHRRMTLSNLSVSFRRFEASSAPLFPFFARCFRRKRFTAIRLVSAIEKNPDNTRRVARSNS